MIEQIRAWGFWTWLGWRVRRCIARRAYDVMVLCRYTPIGSYRP